MAGYSGTPLGKKLGIQEGHRVVLLDAPDSLLGMLEPLPPVRMSASLGRDRNLDVVLAFVTKRSELAKRVASVHPRLAPAGALWIAWPKKASKVPTDVTEHVVRELALPRGLVDNKVCAIDDIWSGLRLVIRRELR
jgi:hypothetical protein